jgi:AraC-like DNA-binding protein
MLKGFVLFGESTLYSNMDDKQLYDDFTVSPSLADSLRTSIRLNEEAVRYYDYPGNSCSAALSYAILGDITRSRLAEQEAFDLIKQHPEYLSAGLYISALIRYREKKYDEAIAIAKKGLAEAEANDKKSDMKKNAGVLYHSYAATGNFANAYKYLQMEYLIQEDIAAEEKRSRVVMAQVKFDTKIKEEQLQKEREHNRINGMKIRFISAGTVLLLVALVIFICLFKQKQKAYRLLVQKSLQWAETSFEQDTAVLPAEEEEPAAALRSDAAFDPEGQYLLMQKVYELLEREKLYMNTDLSIDILARHANTNVKYLSLAINNIAHVNFKTFINQYRIKEAILLIKNMPPGQSFDEIADLCGFSDRSTFYRSFKKETNFTPLIFKRNIV